MAMAVVIHSVVCRAMRRLPAALARSRQAWNRARRAASAIDTRYHRQTGTNGSSGPNSALAATVTRPAASTSAPDAAS